MFNGIIKNTGIVKVLMKNKSSLSLGLLSKITVNKKMIGSSFSCNGVCLTLTSFKKKLLFFYLSNETLIRSNFSKIKIGQPVNIEKSLKFGDEISGHFAQGHIDTVGKILNIAVVDKTWVVRLSVPKNFRKLLIEKASIHINGVSLTISKVKKNYFEINIIPHTLKLTNLYHLKKNNIVNIEFDIFVKYVVDLKK